jgi:hypothetical protein
MKERIVNFSFLAHGSVVQDIKITADDISGEELVRMLKAGEAATTIHEDNDVIALPSFETIGTVVYSDTDLEFHDFQMEGGEIESENALQPFNASRLARQGAIGEFISEEDDLSVEEVLNILYQLRHEKPHGNGLTVEEGHRDKTGYELIREIELFEHGLMNLMTIAHAAGKKGQEIV